MDKDIQVARDIDVKMAIAKFLALAERAVGYIDIPGRSYSEWKYGQGPWATSDMWRHR